MQNNPIIDSLEVWYAELSSTWFILGDPTLTGNYRDILDSINACTEISDIESAQQRFVAMRNERAARSHHNFNLGYGIGAFVGGAYSFWASVSQETERSRIIKNTLFGAVAGGVTGAVLSRNMQPRAAYRLEAGMFQEIDVALQAGSRTLSRSPTNNVGP